MDSGPCWIPPAADIQMGISATLAHVGCASATDVAACLRQAPAQRFVTGPTSSSDSAGLHEYFYAVIDHHVLNEAPLTALRAGHFAPIPLMFGTNEDEMTTLLGALHVVDPSTYHQLVVDTVGQTRALDVETEYAGDSVISYDRALEHMMGDLFFHCRVRRAVQAATSAGVAPVWRFLYMHTIQNGLIDGVPISSYGAGHGLELLLLFRDHLDWWQPTQQELVLSDAMMSTWRELAARGSVTDAIPEWPHASAGSDPYVVLDTPISTGQGMHTQHCDFWDQEDPDPL